MNNNSSIDYRSKEAYDKICALNVNEADRMALQRAKRERARVLDSTTPMTAEFKRKLKAVSDRLLEALVKYEDYIAKGLSAYDQYHYTPKYVEISFWISGDKNHRHLKYPQWYYQYDYKPSRQQRLEIAQLEKEMEAEPNWVDVNDVLFSDLSSNGEDNNGSKDSNCHHWLKLRWIPSSKVRVADVISKRAQRMTDLSRKDTDGICQAFYELKDIYSLALEDMLDITEYKCDLHARIVNY